MIHRTFTAAVLVAITTGCSSSATTPPSATTDAAPDGADAAVPVPSGVLIVGTLLDTDLEVAQSKHDAVAKSGEPTATSLGDVGHTVTLGTTLLGTTQNEFLALDRWSDGQNIDAFYGDPRLQMALGTVFVAPPAVNVYVAQPGWSGYGSVDAANGSDPHYWVIVRGKMKTADLAADKATHDSIAATAGPLAQMAGDVGHVVYTGRDDTQEFLAIDVWPDSTNIASFYSNPKVAQAFGALFEAPPTIGVYRSTHWFQW